jgi:hypothetical protein
LSYRARPERTKHRSGSKVGAERLCRFVRGRVTLATCSRAQVIHERARDLSTRIRGIEG